MTADRTNHARKQAACSVARAFHSAEEGFNIMFERLGLAIAAIPQARMHPGVAAPLESGVDASRHLLAAAASALDGYNHLVSGHRLLGEERDRLITRTTAGGDEFDTPPPAATLARPDPVRHLHAVGM